MIPDKHYENKNVKYALSNFSQSISESLINKQLSDAMQKKKKKNQTRKSWLLEFSFKKVKNITL